MPDSKRIDRENFKMEEVKRRLETFTIDMNTLEKMGDILDKFNPFCFFLRALHFFNITQYDLASQDFEKAHEKGFRDVVRPTQEWYGNMTENIVKSRLDDMLLDCYYHLGIIYYNLGENERSQSNFKEAFSRNPLDFRSRSYIPELMFFSPSYDFNRVITEFTAVENELKGLSIGDQGKFDFAAAMASLKMREGNCYLPKQIELQQRRGYKNYESAERAVSIFKQAYEFAQKIKTRPSLTEIFIRLSLAQSLELVGRSEWGILSPEDLYREVFFDIRKQIPLKTEPILLLLLNYSLAICASRSIISGENPRSYLARAREQLQHIPKRVLIFSPINKINLRQQDIYTEMETFEKSLN